MTELRFFVPGIPISQGSKGARVLGRGPGARAQLFDTNATDLHPWREKIAEYGRLIVAKHSWVPPKYIRADLGFYFDRPPSVPLSRPFPNVKPDVDKLVRAVFDSLTTAGVFGDDAHVVSERGDKFYTTANARPGVHIRVRDALNQEALTV